MCWGAVVLRLVEAAVAVEASMMLPVLRLEYTNAPLFPVVAPHSISKRSCSSHYPSAILLKINAEYYFRLLKMTDLVPPTFYLII